MTAVAKERKSKEIDEMRPMSQMFKSRNSDGRIEGTNIEVKIDANIETNK